MNRITYIIAFIGFELASLGASAQATLTVGVVPTAGHIMVSQSGSTQIISVGDTGENVTWDYSQQLNGLVNDTTFYMNVSQTPFSAEVGTVANLASRNQAEYSFYNRNTSAFSLAAIVLDAGVPGISSLTFKLNPNFTLLKFPAHYNDNYHTVSNSAFTFPFDTTFDLGGGGAPANIDSIRIKMTLTGDSRLNGWGTIIMPGTGETYSCLRQQMKQTTVETIELRTYVVLPVIGRFGLWVPLTTLPGFSQNYINYWTPGIVGPVLSFNSDSAGQNTSGISFQSSAPLAGNKPAVKPASLNVYPNPQ